MTYLGYLIVQKPTTQSYQGTDCDLFREGLISSGKGWELVGKTKWYFIQFLARHNIPYFNETPEELVAKVANLEKLLGDKKK